MGLTVNLYRLLLKQARKLRNSDINYIFLQTFPSPDEFQSFKTTESQEELFELVTRLFPKRLHLFLQTQLTSRYISGNLLHNIVKQGFRDEKLTTELTATNGGKKIGSDILDDAMESIRVLNDQLLLSESSSVKTTSNILTAVSAVIDTESTRGAVTGYNSFYYRVTIENNSPNIVQVLGRHWLIQSPNRKYEVPRFGKGLIGVQPVLNPGQVSRLFLYITNNYLCYHIFNCSVSLT